jgi:hypothetical protein
MRKKDKRILTPKSTIDKWLHYDNLNKKSNVRELLGMETMVYERALEEPDRHFTIHHMKKIGALVGRDLLSVFFACYKKPIGGVMRDEKKFKTMLALDRKGIH